MKQFLILLLLTFTLGTSGNSIAEYSEAHQEASAITVVDTFLNAIISGDTESAIASMGGEMLNDRKARLEDPNYSSFLLNYYSNANYEILGSTIINNTDIAIDTSINFSNNEHATTNRFIVRKDGNGVYRIIAEK